MVYDETLDRPEERVELAPVREGEELDWVALSVYLREQLPELNGTIEVQQFPNGNANLTYLVSFGEEKLVVRRPPFGRIAPKSHDMEREYSVLAGLNPFYDRAPEAVLYCNDESVIGAHFLVSRYRTGEVIWDRIPDSMQKHPDVGKRIGRAVVDALAELHCVDYVSAGLGGLGRPEGYLERQVVGWRKRWDAVATDDVGNLPRRAGDELLRALPRTRSTAIVHNDFKIDNCQFDPSEPDVVKSVFDWDMATIGDPLTDLGTLLFYWPDADSSVPNVLPGIHELGLQSKTQVVTRYAEITNQPLEPSDLSWYEAFGAWKTAVIMQQLYARYLRGETKDPRMAGRGAQVADLSERACDLLSTQRTQRSVSDGDPRLHVSTERVEEQEGQDR